MASTNKNIPLTDLFIDNLLVVILQWHESTGKMPVNRRQDACAPFQRTGEYRASVRGKMRTPAGIFVSVQD
jgi:hypothetical protein